MERTLILKTIEKIGEKVRICGWVNSRRDHGGIVFFDLRDRSGLLQVVCPKDMAENIKDETAVAIEGEVKARPEKMVNPEIKTGTVELKADKIEILGEAETLPFDLRELNLSLPKLLDFRPLSFKNEKIRAIFKIEEEVVDGFRQALKEMDFMEFEAPAIVPANAEGGAEIFSVRYYNHEAFLAQSPQLYKQILVNGFERVFTVCHVFRAEPSVTTRHLSEYISMDAEMGFIESWKDVMGACEAVVRRIFLNVGKNQADNLKILNVELPKVSEKIPQLKMREAQEIIFQRTGRDNRKEPDLEPEDEREICKWADEKYGSELIFITHYPVKKRPFYTFADPDDPEYTMSFDLLCRGSEIVTGGRRINKYQDLLKGMEKKGIGAKNLEFYLQAFQYGMPPEGGFALGSERVVKQILGLANIREAALFPRDMERIDLSLSNTPIKKEKNGEQQGSQKK